MQRFDQWAFPDGEAHLPIWMEAKNQRVLGRLTYQYHKYEFAMKHVKNRRVAVDIGAHIGLWSYFMAKDFKDLAAFEPMQKHRECWIENMAGVNNAEVYSCALGAQKGRVKIENRTFGSTGDTGVVPNESGDTEIMRLDDFNFREVDFIKIDCEGYELAVLQGAVETIKRCKPCIVVEQKGDMALKYGFEKFEALDFLKSIGAKQVGAISGDYIMTFAGV